MWHHVSSMVRYWAARIQCLILAKARWACRSIVGKTGHTSLPKVADRYCVSGIPSRRHRVP